jgi:hypothetical protein
VSGPPTERTGTGRDPALDRIAEAFYRAGRRGVRCRYPVDVTDVRQRDLAQQAYAAGARDAEISGPADG